MHGMISIFLYLLRAYLCLRGEIRGHWGCSYREDKARRPWTYSVQLSEEHLVHTVGRLVSHLGVSQRGSVHASPRIWSILENVPCALEKNVYSAALG